MRIAYLVTNLGYGGTQKWVEVTASELVKRGHEVLVIAESRPHTLGLTLRGTGVDVVCFDVAPSISALGKLLSSRGIDLVHLNVWERRADYVAMRLPQSTVLAISHHWAPNHDLPALVLRLLLLKRGWANFKENMQARSAFDIHIGCCQTSARYFRTLYGSPYAARVFELSNAIPLPVAPTKQQIMMGPARFLQVGSLTYRKRPDLTLAAFCKLKQSLPDAALTFVGNGEMLPDLRQRVQKHGVSDVSFVVEPATTIDAYGRANVVIQVGNAEGLPVVLLEASARGLALIATDAGGTSEFVRDGLNGLLIKRDSKESLVAAMTRLGTSPELRYKLGCVGRYLIGEDCSIERQIRVLLSIYHAAIAWKRVVS
jgi:glycosyltransferase involved in cell wall biosynthesis